MQRLEVSGAVRPIYGSLGVKRLTDSSTALRIFLNSSDIKIGFCVFPSDICFQPKNEHQHTPEADVFSSIMFSPDCIGPLTVYSKG